MNVIAFVHFIVFFVDLLLIVLVLSRNGKALLNRLCALCIATFAVWSLSYGFVHLSSTPNIAMFWVNVSAFGWTTFPIASLFFYLSLTNTDLGLPRKAFAVLCAVLVCFFLYLQWSGHLVVNVIERSYGWSGVWSLSIYSYLYYAYFFIAAAFCIYLTFKFGCKAKTVREKSQSNVLIFTAFAGLLLGSTTDILLPLIGDTVIPQVADIMVSMWGFGIVFSITRYGLMTVTPTTASDHILRTMTESLILLNEKRQVSMANNAVVDLLETHAEEMMGKDFKLIVGEDEGAEDLLNETLAQGKSTNRELTFIAKNGKSIPMLVSASVVRHQKHAVAGFVIVARDISEHKKNSQKLAESEAYLKDIFNSVSAGIVLIDAETHKIVDVNPVAASLIGETKNCIVGSVCHKFICPAESGKCPIIDLKQIVNRSERVLLTATGQKIDILKSVVPMKKNGREHLLEMFVDIGERKQYETNLRIQKELIDRILATTPNGVVVIDEGLKIVMANQSFCTNFYQSRTAIESVSIAELIPVPELLESIPKVRDNSESNLKVEFRYMANSRNRVYLASIFPMQQNQVLMILNDVTEEREKQERLLLTDRLASVGEMAAGIAHELNNPLTGVIGLSKLLLDEEIPDTIKEDLKAIYGEAQRAAAVVKNLLTFARKHAVSKQAVQINSVLEDVLKLRAYEHRVNNIRVVTGFDRGIPEIMADYFQMQQVFLNLVLNAEQAMIEAHREGTLTITSERFNGTVKISIADDGPGISPENLRKLFSPFFTTKEVGKGTGLGLSICYGIVTSHGGKIYAQSELEKGAAFTIEMPIKSSQGG